MIWMLYVLNGNMEYAYKILEYFQHILARFWFYSNFYVVHFYHMSNRYWLRSSDGEIIYKHHLNVCGFVRKTIFIRKSVLDLMSAWHLIYWNMKLTSL